MMELALLRDDEPRLRPDEGGRASDLPRVLNVAQVAALLQVSTKMVHRLPIPYAKVGRFRRYLPEVVIAWVRQQTFPDEAA